MLASLLCLASGAAAARERLDIACSEGCELRLSTRRLIELRIAEPDLRFRVGGRFHADAAVFDSPFLPIENRAVVRRGRVYFGARILEDLRLRVEYEFAPGREGWRNLWARYTPTPWLFVQVGNLVAPLGLDDINSSNNLTFMERALPTALAPEYQTGAAIGVRGELGRRRSRHRLTATVFVGTAPLADPERDRHRSRHVSTGGRITYAPIARRGRVVHFGGSVEYRSVDPNSRYRIRARPESALAPAFLNTGRLREVESVITPAAELLVIAGPISLQAEYIQSYLQRTPDRPNPTFFGAYGAVSWILTGESRRYSRTRATLSSVRPRRRWGAVEAAVRYSFLDLTDETVRGGESKNFTVGLNWYLRENARLMFNMVSVDGRARSTLKPVTFQAFQFRMLLFF